MSSNWVNNLDMLAQNGVLDFDAASFVMGKAPRYVGRPSMSPVIPSGSTLNQPKNDEFKQQNKKDDSFIHNPSWKKWLFGGLALGGLIFGVTNRKAIVKWTKDLFTGKKFKTPDLTKIKDFCSDKWKLIKDFCSKCWNKFTGLFKKP